MSDDHALRVTFVHDARSVRLKSVQRLAMRVLAPVGAVPEGAASGHWLAVEDARGQVLYHMPLHDPFGYDHEVHPATPGEHVRRAPSSRSSGTFEVLVPDLPGSRRLVLHGPPREAARAAPHIRWHIAAVPLVSHSFAALRGKTVKKKKAPGKPVWKAKRGKTRRASTKRTPATPQIGRSGF